MRRLPLHGGTVGKGRASAEGSGRRSVRAGAPRAGEAAAHMTTADQSHVLTVEEAARILRVGRSAAYEGVRSGAIPCVRIGRSIRVPRVALERMLAAQADEGEATTR